MKNDRDLIVDKNNFSLLFFMNAILVTTFLFYIDEGYYNFNWMKNPGSWLIFGIYSLALSFAQWMTYRLFGMLKFKNNIGLVLSLSVGVIFGLMFVVTVIFS